MLLDDDNDQNAAGGARKKPKTYLITDTPDHKQNSTIIRTKQEKLKKRFSFHQLSTNSPALPVIPDTPVKSNRTSNFPNITSFLNPNYFNPFF